MRSLASSVVNYTDDIWSYDNMEAPDHGTLAWGCTKDGQLGLGGVEAEQVSIPQEVKGLRGREVVGMGCGENHTLFLLAGGTLCSCGNNDMGQLGHVKPTRRRPEAVSVLETQVVVEVDCGAEHTVAITDTGQMFSWGSNLRGQLGRGYTDEPCIRTPKLVKSLSTFTVLSVSCGHQHNLALTDDGQLFSWGDNSHGQLGYGIVQAKYDTPQRVATLTGVPLSQVRAGSHHSLALTTSGALFAWGRNTFGQLGIGDQSDRGFPTLLKLLRYQRVMYVDAGEDFTVALTADGGLFTFGAGSHGQLGHNSNSNQLQPLKVSELMGSVVTQVAAGRRHTLAYVQKSGRLYAFGLGGNGQLGVGEFHTRKSPTTVKGPFIPFHPSGAFANQQPVNERLPPCVNHRIYCGGDQSFATFTSHKLKHQPDDFRIPNKKRQIQTLNQNILDDLVSVPANSKPPHESLDIIEKLFKSQTCLNASFLLPDGQHFGCNSKNHGINLDEALETFKRLSSLPNHVLANKVESMIERSLIPSLSTRLPDVEAMRILLLLPFTGIFQKPQYYSFVHCPFARFVTSLDAAPGQILSLWWSHLPAEYFNKLVKVYKKAVVHVLYLPSPNSEREATNRQNSLTPCMDVLKKLNDVSISNGMIIPYDAFYVPELTEKLDIRADYINWLKQNARTQGQPLSFCNYPFVFDGQAKTLLLQTDAMLQMQVAIDEVMRRNMTSLIIPEIDPTNPCLILCVTRENILQDTINQLTKQGNGNFKKPLKVIFLGEEAVDEGGVVKEFFLLILREVFDPKYGMFEYFEESRLFWFNSETFEDPAMFTLIGVLCGLAIYNAIIIDLKFPLALFKMLLDRPATLEDLLELEPTVGRSLQELLNYEENDVEDVFCLNFAVSRESYGRTQTIELVPGGSDIVVTRDNKADYVKAYIENTFKNSTAEQFQAFANGFHRVCGGSVMGLFHPQELQAMVVGNENYEWELLEQSCDYKDGYHRNYPTIRYFWDVFRELSTEDKKKFLRFLTGSDRIPIHGMKAIKIFIQPTGGGDSFLPAAHTCFNLLDLPRYSSREVLKEKLVKAIQQTEGFGIV